ncbi:MAG: hypothetical protein R2851_23400 [Caldilineaceae bacterium]
MNPSTPSVQIATFRSRTGPWCRERRPLILVLGLLLAAVSPCALPARADTQASASPWTTPAVIQPGDDIVYTVQAINSSSAITAATVGLTLTTPVGVTFDQCAIQAPFTGACSGLAGGVDQLERDAGAHDHGHHHRARQDGLQRGGQSGHRRGPRRT